MRLQQRIELVEEKIAAACARSGRSRNDVNIIAVTKYVSTEATVETFRSGLGHLGENRWQDAQAKWQALSEGTELQAEGAPTWHFIGSLQTNKVKDVVGKFTYIHSLDRLSLAEAIHKHASRLGIVVPCFLQVNVSGEATKHGMEPEQLPAFLEQLSACDAVKPIGLMTMAPHEADPEATRAVFRSLRELRDRLRDSIGSAATLEHLSMGMSNDFEVAIEEGATWLRLGSILVGTKEE